MLTLTQQALNLPYHARAELVNTLKTSLDAEERLAKAEKNATRGQQLFAIMAKTIGCEVSRTSRMVKFMDARMMIAYRLLEEGYTTTEVGKMIGKDHATIVHLRKRMLDCFDLPLVYDNELSIWNLFNENIKRYDTTERNAD